MPTDQAEMFLHFLNKLECENIPYCILAGYESYPELIPSDIDFMVGQEQLARLPLLMQEIATETGSTFVQFLRHETSACYFVIAKQDGCRISFLHPDACSDYRRKGKLWITARGMLARRRKHARGFFIPAADDAFTYYLIKKIEKGSISEAQGDHLAALFAEGPDRCLKKLRDLWSQSSVEVIKTAAMENAWGGVLAGRLTAELYANSPHESLLRRSAQGLGEIRRRISRVLKPTGLFVVFLGPDGAGKTTLIERVELSLAPAFRKNRRFHLRPRLGAKAGEAVIVTTPHEKPPRTLLFSLLKLGYFWCDYAMGYLAVIRPLLVRSTLVLFDRYYHDLLVDPRRYRFGGPVWIAGLIARLVPKPDLWVILDAPPEVLQSRKQEVSFAETTRQREAYLAFAQKLNNSVVVDASQSLEVVLDQTIEEILHYMSQRVSRRLGTDCKWN